MQAAVTDWINMRRNSDIIYPWVHRTALAQVNSTSLLPRPAHIHEPAYDTLAENA